MKSQTIDRQPEVKTRMGVLPQIRHWILLPAVLAVAVLALGLTMKSVRALTAADLAIDQAVSRDHSTVLNGLALALNSLFSPVGGIIMLVLVCLFLLVERRSPVNAIAVGAITSAGWLSSEVFKVLVPRHRPDPGALLDPLVSEPASNSFPSGHTSLAVSLAIALFLLARGTRWERPTLACGAVMAVAVAASRVYLGVHYPTDVAASFPVSIAGITFFAGLWNRYALRLLARVNVLRRFGPVPYPAR